jgi:redox-sensing transcriptional repressor
MIYPPGVYGGIRTGFERYGSTLPVDKVPLADFDHSMPGNIVTRIVNVPQPTINRLPRYLFCLEQFAGGAPTISSSELARLADETAATVRKDLSYLGSHGTRGIGYDVAALQSQIRGRLGLDQSRDVVIVGAGHLGSALTNYDGFGEDELRLIGIYDISPAAVGKRIGGMTVRHVDEMQSDLANRRCVFGIIAVPTDAAQEVADELVNAGVAGILSFASTFLRVPRSVFVRHIDLATEMHTLSYYVAARRRSL